MQRNEIYFASSCCETLHRRRREPSLGGSPARGWAILTRGAIYHDFLPTDGRCGGEESCWFILRYNSSPEMAFIARCILQSGHFPHLTLSHIDCRLLPVASCHSDSPLACADAFHWTGIMSVPYNSIGVSVWWIINDADLRRRPPGCLFSENDRMWHELLPQLFTLKPPTPTRARTFCLQPRKHVEKVFGDKIIVAGAKRMTWDGP